MGTGPEKRGAREPGCSNRLLEADATASAGAANPAVLLLGLDVPQGSDAAGDPAGCEDVIAGVAGASAMGCSTWPPAPLLCPADEPCVGQGCGVEWVCDEHSLLPVPVWLADTGWEAPLAPIGHWKSADAGMCCRAGRACAPGCFSASPAPLPPRCLRLCRSSTSSARPATAVTPSTDPTAAPTATPLDPLPPVL